MQITRFRLLARNSGPPNSPPTWHVSVAIGEHGRGTDGTPTLTPDCVTEEEIEYWFDKLIAELKELRGRAKQKVRRA
jgi:hypothetical protein